MRSVSTRGGSLALGGGLVEALTKLCMILLFGLSTCAANLMFAGSPRAATRVEPTSVSGPSRQQTPTVSDGLAAVEHARRIKEVRARVLAWRLENSTLVHARRIAPAGRRVWSNAIAAGTTPEECLTQAIYYESRGESEAGQDAVARVVLNRTQDPRYPKNVCGVVFQGASRPGCQFSFACEGDVQARLKLNPDAWRRANESARRALNGAAILDPSVSGATNYHTDRVAPRWDAGLTRLAQIGRHIFFGVPGRVVDAPTPPAVPDAARKPASWTDLIWSGHSA